MNYARSQFPKHSHYFLISYDQLSICATFGTSGKFTWEKVVILEKSFEMLVLGYIGVTESENALSFTELALVFNKIFCLGPIFRVAVGIEFQFPFPSHSHRNPVGIPMGILMGITIGILMGITIGIP